MKQHLRMALLALGLVIIGACTQHSNGKATKVPDLSFPAVSGGELKLADYRGKLIYVDFWATWCGPCTEAIPELNTIHEKYKTRGFAVLGISVDDLSLEAISHFAETEKMVYPVALGTTEDMALFGPSPGLPTGYLVNDEGVVVKKFIGQLPAATLEAEIERVLAGAGR